MSTTPAPRQDRGFTLLGLIVALAATSALVITGGSSEGEPAARSERLSMTAAWPTAKLGTIPDLPLRPLLFLDTATAVGTAPSEDDGFLRLLLRSADGSVRELRRLATADGPRFENPTVAGNDVVWTEFADGRPPEIWAASLRADSPARRLTADTGNAVFYGSEYELVPHDGRVYWTATPHDGATATEIRSVALRGGKVRITRAPGQWTMAAWPWLDDGGSDGTGALLLRNMSTGREVTVPAAGGEFPACSPVWCRVLVLGDDGPVRLDLMRPDGSDRRQIAGRGIRSAVPDVAILDRFEILAETGPDSDVTGTAKLLVHDISSGNTVELASAANDARSRGGLVWWYTSGAGTAQWQVLDLRTA